jgi:hypothetical protein
MLVWRKRDMSLCSREIEAGKRASENQGQSALAQTKNGACAPFFLCQVCHRAISGLHSAQLAHLALQIVLQANFANQLNLGFQEVDVLFGVIEDLLQQVA